MIDRHRTAISRDRLSRGARSALEDGLLQLGVCDYGSGRGDDVRHLLSEGCDAHGWDPHYSPAAQPRQSSAVLLTYVLNAIESEAERVRVLKHAWSLARDVLVVTVRLHWERGRVQGAPYRDGVITQRNTFQHLYQNEELLELLRRVTGVAPVLGRPGVAYCFRLDEQRLTHVFRRWTGGQGAPVMAAMGLEGAVRFLEGRGRLPLPSELPPASELPRGWGPVARRAADAHLVEAARRRHTLDTLGALALQRFHGPLQPGDLLPSFREDVRVFFGSFSHARWRAERLLGQLRDRSTLRSRMRASTCGKETPTALYVHQRALPQVPLLLRLYEACAALACGRPDAWSVAKLHHDSYKVSWLDYPEFDRHPHPTLSMSWTVDLTTLSMRVQDFTSTRNRPLLHRKHEFLAEDDPRASLYRRLTGQEVRAGLYLHPERIGREDGWQTELTLRKVQLRGHRVVRDVRDQREPRA